MSGTCWLNLRTYFALERKCRDASLASCAEAVHPSCNPGEPWEVCGSISSWNAFQTPAGSFQQLANRTGIVWLGPVCHARQPEPTSVPHPSCHIS